MKQSFPKLSTVVYHRCFSRSLGGKWKYNFHLRRWENSANGQWIARCNLDDEIVFGLFDKKNEYLGCVDYAARPPITLEERRAIMERRGQLAVRLRAKGLSYRAIAAKLGRLGPSSLPANGRGLLSPERTRRIVLRALSK